VRVGGRTLPLPFVGQDYFPLGKRVLLGKATRGALPKNPFLPKNRLRLPKKSEGPRVTPDSVRAARRHGPLVSAGVLGGASCPRRAPLANRRECSCGIFLSALVFENVRQRVGCKRLLNLKGVMSIAVECERFTLTAERIRNPDYISTWDICKHRIPSGGDS